MPSSFSSVLRVAIVALCGAAMVAACGGGGGNAGEAARLAQVCAMPRTGLDPFNDNQPYPDRQGTLAVERSWVLAHMNEVYLWPDEIPPVNATLYSTSNFGSVPRALDAYFNALRTPALTASGKRKDQFSFTLPTADWLAESEGGVVLGYGAQFMLLATAPPRQAVIAYTEPGAPGTSLARGLRVLAINGVDFVNDNTQAGVDVLNAALFPRTPGEQHLFRFQPQDGVPFEVLLTAQPITRTPVPTVKTFDTASGRVGYLLFHDHIAIAEGALFDAVRTLRDAGIDDLVLDLRYNGGGFLDIAAELAYMIAGADRTADRDFERLQFSAQNPRGAAATVTPFHPRSQGFDPALPIGTALPTLDLPRVFVLSTAATCSASEAIINGLRGVDVQVIQIGGTSCGKPYGFYPTDNCGLTYFAAEFAGANAKGFGDYADGFVPDCAARDDLARALGDPAETMLASALAYRDSGQCAAAARAGRGETPQLLRSPLRENRWMRQA